MTVKSTVLVLAFALAAGAAYAADSPRSGNVVRGAVLRTSSSATWLASPGQVVPALRPAKKRPAARKAAARSAARRPARPASGRTPGKRASR